MALTAAIWSGSAGFVCLPPTAFHRQVQDGQTLLIAEASSSRPFVEAVPSWNASWKGGQMKVDLQGIDSDSRETVKFGMGTWTLGTEGRTSIKGQKSADGEVQTDTVIFAKPCRKIRVILTLLPDTEGRSPELKSFFLSLTPPDWKAEEDAPFKAAWGSEIAVPKKAQHDYPNGGVLCSPTSVSMLMNYRAQEWSRPELGLDVPEVVKMVFDPAWGGTGNWSFNMAFPGSFPGVVSFVSRLSSLSQAEQLIASKIPIACSVDYKVLLDRQWDGDGGHLVVLIGFTPEGDPIINDPAKGPDVRQIYPRARFASAWASSKNTVYIIASSSASWPSAQGPWPSPGFAASSR